MKKTIILLTLAAWPLLTQATEMAGTWKMAFDSQVGLQKYTFTFQQDGTNLTGEAISEINGKKSETALTEGKVVGDTISFVELLNFEDKPIRITYTGLLSANGQEINFTREVGDLATEEVVARRERAAVSGTWKMAFDSQVGPQKYTLTFQQVGTILTGKAVSEINDKQSETALTEGKVDGDAVSFVEVLDYEGQDIRITYTGKLSANGREINFTREVGDLAKEEVVARRE